MGARPRFEHVLRVYPKDCASKLSFFLGNVFTASAHLFTLFDALWGLRF